MGYVHHSVYPLYLEQGRMELLISNGLDILQLEKDGIILPVSSISIRYQKPLIFNEQIRVETILEYPFVPSLKFRYKIFRSNKEIIARAETKLVLANSETREMITHPEYYLKVLERSGEGE